jgi:hypothetical protein
MILSIFPTNGGAKTQSPGQGKKNKIMMKPKSLAQPDKLFFGQFKDDTGK